MTRESVGTVIALYISKKGESLRINKKEIACDSNGIVDDKFYGNDQDRSILITSQESYELVQNEGIDIQYGLLGENILIDFNPYTLPINTKLKMGNVILQITQNCTVCNHLSVIDKRIPKLLKTDRGIFAKVIQDGTMQIGDNVEIMQ